jgi:hypothetical protein
MLLLDDVTEFVVGDDFVELTVGHLDEEFYLLMVRSIVVDNLSCHGSPELSTILHVTNEGETKEFARTEMRKFEIRRVDIQAREIGGGEEDGIARLPITGTHT